jgi:DNA-binding NarL/FixJ family response regulator
VVAEADDGRKAINLCKSVEPDVVVLDLAMPQLDGIEATSQLRRLFPQLGIVILSMHDQEAYVLRALHAGANAFVMKGADSQEIVRAVRAAQRGEYHLCSRISKGVIEIFLRERSGRSSGEPYESLTDREQQVFHLLVEGYSANRIADMLFLSPKTVEKHRANTMRKLNCPDFLSLVKYAVRIGLIDPDSWKA